MIGQIISHYAPKAHPPLVDKIFEKLAEGGMFGNSPRTSFVRLLGFRQRSEISESGMRGWNFQDLPLSQKFIRLWRTFWRGGDL